MKRDPCVAAYQSLRAFADQFCGPPPPFHAAHALAPSNKASAAAVTCFMPPT